MVNSVHLLGRLGAKPEIRYTQNGTPVAKFSLATSTKYQDKAGNKKETTQWHNCVVWGKSAEAIEKYSDKGSLLFCEGELEYSDYQNKQGQKVYRTEIKVHNFKFLDSPEKKVPPQAGTFEEFRQGPLSQAQTTINFDDPNSIPF